MKRLCLLLAATTIAAAAQAETLRDLVDKRIADKSAESAAKQGKLAAPKDTPGVEPAPHVNSVSRPSAEIFHAEDIQVYTILGVGDALRAKVRYRGDSQLELTKGQSVGGCMITTLTPDTVVFEQLRPVKSKGEKAVAETLRPIPCKTVYLSGVGASTTSGAGGGGGAMPTGSPVLRMPQN